ncbi:unnamed protein product, partial [Linum tenue]
MAAGVFCRGFSRVAVQEKRCLHQRAYRRDGCLLELGETMQARGRGEWENLFVVKAFGN